MQRYLDIQKYRPRPNCFKSCQLCDDCKQESPTIDCWRTCKTCIDCKVDDLNNRSYNDPYFYIHQPRKLSQTPALAKQTCENICGPVKCNEFKQRQASYGKCKQSGANGCERIWGDINPNGSEFGYVAPMDPMFRDCK